jgi:integrase
MVGEKSPQQSLTGTRARGTSHEQSRRHVPISERMLQLSMVRCSVKREGWLFPSPRAKCGRLTTVAKQFREARRKAGLPECLVLYCARHTFGTAAYAATGNLAMVMNVMGHTDVRTAMRSAGYSAPYSGTTDNTYPLPR